MYRHIILAVLSILAVGAMLFVGPIPQDMEYHKFVDQYSLWGIPNFYNVMSNIPFIIVGLWGLKKYRTDLVSQAYKTPYLILSYGVILTAFGSGWYHLIPANQSLVWDRLPMTIAFMSLFSLIIRDYVHGEMGRKMLFPALFFGALSILYWHITEQMGAGDLRPYVLVQFLPMLLIPTIMALYKPRYSNRADLILVLVFYFAAKMAEYYDGMIYDALGGSISGHSIKHLLAAAGSYYALKMFLIILEDSHCVPPEPQG
ncbi:MAG: ceramidase domain-containing protein [Emcibacter sp.]|nr:ceramidase domain-containing protein [Emcibacter sp.]